MVTALLALFALVAIMVCAIILPLFRKEPSRHASAESGEGALLGSDAFGGMDHSSGHASDGGGSH